jgi:hypothetical protein
VLAASAVRHSRTVVQLGQLLGRGETPQHSNVRAQTASTIATQASTDVAVTHASAAASGAAMAGPQPTAARATKRETVQRFIVAGAYRRALGREAVRV